MRTGSDGGLRSGQRLMYARTSWSSDLVSAHGHCRVSLLGGSARVVFLFPSLQPSESQLQARFGCSSLLLPAHLGLLHSYHSLNVSI